MRGEDLDFQAIVINQHAGVASLAARLTIIGGWLENDLDRSAVGGINAGTVAHQGTHSGLHFEELGAFVVAQAPAALPAVERLVLVGVADEGEFSELAGQINTSMPHYVVSRTAEALNTRAKAVKGSRILLMGLAYKENVDDMRESPTFELLHELADLGADVSYYDPHVPVIGPTREHARWKGIKSIAWSEETVAKFDCVLIATNHAAFDLPSLLRSADLIVDTRNAIAKAGLTAKDGQVVKA